MKQILCTLALTAALPCAQAAVIDFNSVPSSGNPILSTLTTQGFTFTSAHFHTVDAPGSCIFGGCVSNGTIYLGVDAPSLGFPIVMTAVGGGTFTLNSFDGDKLFLDDAAALAGGFGNATSIMLAGTQSGGGSLNTTFALSGGSAFQSFILPATWTNLTSVTFSGIAVGASNRSFALDNIGVNVPEPATATLLIAGALLISVGLKRRR